VTQADAGFRRESREPEHPVPAAGRLSAVDNLKALLVAWIIGCHALLGYTAIGGWPYDEVNEVTMSPATELLLSVVLGPTALVVVATFFFVAGLFAPVSVSRHGPGRFGRARLVRLGLPWLASMLLIWPLFMWLAYRSAGYPMTYRQAFGGRQPFLDAGPLWFAQILLYASLGYALWSWLGLGRRLPRITAGSGHLLVAIGAMTLVSFTTRLWFPARSQQIMDLHVWQWPQCIGMFCLGVVASGEAWAVRVPHRVLRFSGLLTLSTLIIAPLVALAAGVTDLNRDGGVFLGGWRWQALVLDAIEASLVVAGSVWLLGMAQRHLAGVTWLGAVPARSAYAAFVLQAPVLLSLAILARLVSIPALYKGVLVATFAVVLAFGLGWLIIARTSARVRAGREPLS
jgi:acyltransferase-like protein